MTTLRNLVLCTLIPEERLVMRKSMTIGGKLLNVVASFSYLGHIYT